MPSQLREFLLSEVLCCLAVSMPNGGVHAAVLRFWCDITTLNLYMATSKTSEKMWWLSQGKTFVQASVAIGLVHQMPYSLQMRGTLETFDPKSDEHVTEEFSRIVSDLNDIHDPKNTMIVFRPDWARYTDRATKQKLTYLIDLG